MSGLPSWYDGWLQDAPEPAEKECPICTALMDWVDDHDGIGPCGDWVCPECEKEVQG
jgi:endogenous inhibitor of DNA gyrase (YacG/DUF329 family)